MKNKKMIVMCGLPRSGKSTLVKKIENGEVVISADEFRKVVYGQRYYQEGESMMWAIRDITLKILMQQGTNLIIDETNTTVEARAKILKLVKKYGYSAQCIYVEENLNVCKQRAVDTEQLDLIPIIDKMYNQLAIPTIEEGFEKVVIG